MRVLFTIQYLGTRYCGWQSQENALSVQQVVEEALEKTFKVPVRIHGAGRTDAGVHAAAQRAHADIPFAIPTRGLILGVNQLLPADVRIVAVEEVADTFHCRFDARSKRYQYRIWNAPVADVFAAGTHAHVAQPLEAARMHEALQAVLGTHDFKAFTVATPLVGETVRTITHAAVARHDSAVIIDIAADGFLRYMVRRIAGSLIEAGRGRLDTAALSRSLAPTFETARWTAPAKGLTMIDVSY